MVFEIEFHNRCKGQGGFEIGTIPNRLTFSNFAMTSIWRSRYDHLGSKAPIMQAFAGSFGKIQNRPYVD